MGKNVFKQDYRISIVDRNTQNRHCSFLIWFTGLSGSGKSTLANALEVRLHQELVHTYTLDGDNIRKGINNDLTFTQKGRKENIRRVAEISKLFIDAGVVVLAAFISPYKEDRDHIKKIVGEDNFIEVYVNTSIQECERRDVKGLYKKARSGEIKNFTGVGAPYEEPLNPTIEIKTEFLNIQEAVDKMMAIIKTKLSYE